MLLDFKFPLKQFEQKKLTYKLVGVLFLIFSILIFGYFISYRSNNPDIFPRRSSEPLYKDPTLSAHVRAGDLLNIMTLEEKIGQLTQYSGLPNIEENILKRHAGSFLHLLGDDARTAIEINNRTRLRIPLLLGIDAIHGHTFIQSSTVFPTQLGYSTSWDPDLSYQIGNITAFEMRYSGPAWTFSPVACLTRDLRWGRVGETFGEDPFLLSKLVVPLMKGLQGEEVNSDPNKVLATAKHYVGYGETVGALDAVQSDLSRRKLLSFFMKPFELLTKAGVGSFMTAYQAVDGIPASINKWLIDTNLREKWGFKGFIVTDWNNVGRLYFQQHVVKSFDEGVEKSLKAGIDMAMATNKYYDSTLKLVKNKVIHENTINKACLRILETKFKLGLFEDPRMPDTQKLLERTGTKEHKKVALDAALESLVLLQNNNDTLPLNKDKLKNVLLLGPNADNIFNQLGDWSLNKRYGFFNRAYDRTSITTIKDGLASRLGTKLTYNVGCTIGKNGYYDQKDEDDGPDYGDIDEAMKLVDKSDLVIIAVGDSIDYTGERHTTATLQLMGNQEELINRVAKSGKKFIIAIVASKPLILPPSAEKASAILLQFNPGAMGGEAFAQILFGESEPRGRLTLSIPHHSGQLPSYYQRPRGEHGKGYADLPGPIAKYPFGYGLLYTDIEYVSAETDKSDYTAEDIINVSIKLRNNGKRKGTEVVQCYVHIYITSVAWPSHELKGYQIVTLEPNEEKTVTIQIPASELTIVNEDEEYAVEPGKYAVWVGKSATDIKHKLDFRIV